MGMRDIAANATRAKMLEAARVCFKSLGYERSTIRDIAKTAGMSTGAFFAHWKGKEAVYVELYGHPPLSPEQGLELLAVLRGEMLRPQWLNDLTARQLAA